MSTTGRVNILVADDLAEKRLVFRSVLEELGQNLIMAQSGTQALQQVLAQDFAVILLDVNMPDIDGFETANMIRRYKRAAHTPIIFVTAYADEMQMARGYSLGAVDYIFSPVVPEILRSKVRVFVELHQMREALSRSHQELERRVEERTAELVETNDRLVAEIIERKKAEAEVAESHALLKTLFDTAPAGLAFVDTELRFLRVNETFAAINGLPAGEHLGRAVRDVLPKLAPALERIYREVMETGKPKADLDITEEIASAPGSQRHFLASYYPVANPAGQVLGVGVIIFDVTERKQAEEALHHQAEQLAYQATHDLLTGLVNRREFERRLQRVLGAAQGPHALLYLDLDQFKLVNDTCGHIAGDELLRQLATVLRAQLRERDTLARLGGDEFGVVLEHCRPGQALRIAHALVQTVQDFQFVWEGKSFTIGVSIGLVSIPEGGDTLTNVLSAADRACYTAKDKGRNRVHIYAPSDEELTQREGEMQWIPRLHRALAQGHFRLCAQPIVALGANSAKADHYEVLLRLVNEPDKDLLLPGAFIPAAERYQQMRAVDRWVIRTTFSTVQIHDLPGCYAINISGQSLGDEEFLDFVLTQLDQSGIAPTRVCFEITETAAITDFTSAIRYMTTLKARGCRFALDDFGSGLSSFGYLKTLPVDYLKIDGRFVKDITQDALDHAMVQAIHQIGQVMGIKTVAEAVETEAILDRVRSIGVDYGQGYAIAIPQPLELVSPVSSSRLC